MHYFNDPILNHIHYNKYTILHLVVHIQGECSTKLKTFQPHSDSPDFKLQNLQYFKTKKITILGLILN